MMFWTLRNNNPEIDWIVLFLDAKILCDLDCAFCSDNAGSASMYNMPLHERKGKKAFLKLFEDFQDKPSRKILGIGTWFPTNPQAEVLVFDTIPITYIKNIYFQNRRVLNQYKDFIPTTIKAEVDGIAFSSREDWKYWIKKR